MALDIGKVRTGIAISDPMKKIATPLAVLPTGEVIQGAPSFRRLLEDYEVELFLCGMPYTLKGEVGPQAIEVKKAAARISDKFGTPHTFADERMSSAHAKRILRGKGLTEREMRGKIDMIAASLFLQSWLDSHEFEC
jgi:putative Holliday junction resolvase